MNIWGGKYLVCALYVVHAGVTCIAPLPFRCPGYIRLYIRCTSDCRALVSLALCDSSLYIFLPSANILKVGEILEDISLTKIRNKIGPKIVPCGTPDVTQDQDE